MAEPTTALTDWVLSTIALVLALRLLRSREPPSAARRLWAGSFLAMATGALSGGVVHALAATSHPGLQWHLWSLTYVSLGLANLALAAAAAWAGLPRAYRGQALALLVVRFVGYLALILPRRELRWAAADGALTLLLLLFFALHARARRDPIVPPLLAAIVLTVVGGIVQGQRLAPHPQFNHNDLFHVIQMAGLFFFYRAGRRLRDHTRGGGPP